MKRGVILGGLALIFILIFSSFVFSSVSPGKNPLNLSKTTYAPEETIQGTINISISSESGDNLLSYSTQSISLLNFLTDSSLVMNEDYFCSSASCRDIFKKTELSKPEKTVSSGYIGLLISGSNVEVIEPVSFTVKGNSNSESCSSQYAQSPLSIDILADGTIDWKYLDAGDFCPQIQRSSCFDEIQLATSSRLELAIDNNGFCQKIDPPMSSKFKIYATIKKIPGRTGKLILSMYESTTGVESSCQLSNPVGAGYEELNCSVNFTVSGETDREYYICIKDKNYQSISNYNIEQERTSPKCGYYGLPSSSEYLIPSGDFPLKFQAASIAPFNKDKLIDENEIAKFRGYADLTTEINDYLYENYNSHCDSFLNENSSLFEEFPACVLPIKISSTSPVLVSNFSISYYIEGTGIIDSYSKQNIFSIEKTPPKISTNNYTLISLESANFSAPSEFGSNYSFSISINGNSIGFGKFDVVNIPSITKVFPQTVFAGVESSFTVSILSSKKIVSYDWDFGDETILTTPTSSASHAYSSLGTFNLTVTATNNESISGTETFKISVISPKDAISLLLNYKQNGIDVTEKNISDLSTWQQSYIKRQLSIDELKNQLIQYNASFKSAKTDSKYLEIVNGLNGVDAPLFLYYSSQSNNFPYIIQPDYVDLAKLSDVGAGDYVSEQEEFIKEQISVWQSSTFNTKINTKTISVKKESGEEELATVIDLSIAGSYNKPGYIIFPYSEVYSSENLKNGTEFSYLEFNSLNNKIISLMLPGKIELQDFSFVISPNFEDLGIIASPCNADGICGEGEDYNNCRMDCKPIGRGITLFILLLVIAGIGFILMKYYYSNRYETHLFKNKHDFENLKLFIKTAQEKDKKNKEIKEKLKKVGWKSEQIDYAFLALEKEQKKASSSETPMKTSTVQEKVQGKQRPNQGFFSLKRPFRRRI